MPSAIVTSRCAHCGEPCARNATFCCAGCKTVYELLNEHGLCDYYTLNENPGSAQRTPVRPDKFAFLDDPKTTQQLLQYQDAEQAHVTFHLPNIHCSSCLWLLENIHRVEPGIRRSEVVFSAKEARIVYDPQKVSLRKVAETLTSIGYEPYISLQDLRRAKPPVNRKLIYQLGVAGFCFANIMLLSFPEYFGDPHMESSMENLFRYLNLALSLPVFLYSAQAFYSSAWNGIKHGFLNIDVPIVLAIVTTFTRSLVDVLMGTGSGYFDSMTGIVLFMLAGRLLQDKTYKGLSFDRDYTAYFPVAVTVMKDGLEKPVQLPDIRTGDTLLIHHQELVPADGILVRGKARIDYSFVTGESVPVEKQMGEIIYAGGRQLDGNMEILTIREVAQSYLTSLWNRTELQQEKKQRPSFIHLLGQYFTWVVLFIAAVTTIYWGIHDKARIWPAVTSILIVACPCALLLASSFTNGHILRILSRRGLYLRNAQAIESLAATTHVVFDKTGTLTGRDQSAAEWQGRQLTVSERSAISALAAQSLHPASRMVLDACGKPLVKTIDRFEESAGQGLQGWVHQMHVQMGSAAYTGARDTGSAVHVNINGDYAGCFRLRHPYREGIRAMLRQLPFERSLISGDHDGDAPSLQQLMGTGATLRFRQQPQDKLDYVLSLQQKGERVLMIGDGLNDAGALKQSDTGISIADDGHHFTPASDGILEAKRLRDLPAFIRIGKASRRIVLFAFAYSVIYNITGLYFAVQGLLSPLTAAILMPSSSISIIILTYGMSEWAARRLPVDDHHRSL
ncbi:heavy metal translocating P-type ATPase [Chitinophaga lutea]